tara:strand:+ start:226 stop:1176 length:951 start_codon:yes stop_codon:yes gene_type:complete
MKQKSLSARSVSILPILLMIFIHVIVTPLREVFKIEPLLMIPYYLIGVLICIVIYRRTNVIKDYEYRRSKVMKKMKNIYSAEESGVWQTNAEISSVISDQSSLSKNVSQISSEAPELEVSNENNVEIDMLNESDKIVEATRRVSGKSNFDEQEVESTIGATRNLSPMDKFLDFVGGLFGRTSAKEYREKQRFSALQAAATAAPVKAQRPNAPIQYERNEVLIEQDSNEINDDISPPMESENFVNSGDMNSNPKTYPNFSARTIDNVQTQSIESMAMMNTFSSQVVSQKLQNSKCRGCGYSVKKEQRFCENCGLDIN